MAHLFKLMDLDSLPEHCAGDGMLGSVRNVSFLLSGGHDVVCFLVSFYRNTRHARTILVHSTVCFESSMQRFGLVLCQIPKIQSPDVFCNKIELGLVRQNMKVPC